MELERSSLSVTERIRRTEGEFLGVSYRELAGELAKLTDENNSQAVQELFDAYLQRSLRESKDEESPEDTRAIALCNFDFVARLSDKLKIESDILEAGLMVFDNSAAIGDVTRFCRSAVGYSPEQVPPTP